MTSPFIQQIADNRVCQVLTCLPEKFVVDFANGIDVAQEHIRTAGERTFFRRLKEGLTGEGAARQNAINASLAQGVEASLRWLTEMTTSLATTNYAIKALAECGTQISMVSGASIGAFNGAIIAASPDLSEAAVRLEALWDHLGNNQVLSVNRLVYFSLLKKLFQAMNLCQIPGRAGALLTTLLRHISTINGFDNLMAQPLLSDEPLTALMDHYLDTDALADGLPLYVSLYPTEGGMQDIIDCIRAELGVGTTKNAVFQHIQSLPRGQQKEALLASAALPLLFRPREVQGTMFGDGGMGGWRNMQGNTPVTPLVDAGCNMVIVTHLSDGSLWDRQAFPDTTILEIRPRKRLKYAGDGGNSGGLLSFTSAHTDAWRQQGYEDTMLAMEHIRKPLAARQALTRSEAVLQKSLDITEEADLALRNAMARIK
ncbi:diguanylate cyclase regulator RdcB family protein [Escherichia coli]|nr:patatin-like phospholipase family protein [Escherichia coli]